MEDDWNEDDIRQIKLNNRALHYLFNLMDANEFFKVIGYSIAKVLWDQLELRGTRINILVKKF